MGMMGKNVAIVLAAGKGTRMGTEVPKQFLHIQDDEAQKDCRQPASYPVLPPGNRHESAV